MNASSSLPASALRAIIAPYAHADWRRSIFQLTTTLGCFVAVCAASYLLYPISWLISLALAPLGGGLLVRLFALQHDCTHGSFFASQRANVWAGRLCSLFTVTPFLGWGRLHLLHHAEWNDLHRSDLSDIYSACLTVREYKALPRGKRLAYRLPRHPLFAIFLLPPLIFALLLRLPLDTPRTMMRARRSIFLTDAALLALYGGLALLLGWQRVLVVQLPIVAAGSMFGCWVLYVMHHFDGSRWLAPGEWDYAEASLAGSSWLAFPRILHWLSGNLGVHHVHHLNARIPNYNLETAAEALQARHPILPVSLSAALRATSLALWDEDARRLVSFREAAA
jgi:acyl-lipid omega-6 desaturase (Delta-12 desaturase)